MKETWKIINSLLNKSKGKNNHPTHFLDNNTKDTDYNHYSKYVLQIFFKHRVKSCKENI